MIATDFKIHRPFKKHNPTSKRPKSKHPPMLPIQR